MGHKGDIAARYSTNKDVLPPDMIEDMRKAYRDCEPFHSTATQPLEQSSIIKEAKIARAKKGTKWSKATDELIWAELIKEDS